MPIEAITLSRALCHVVLRFPDLSGAMVDEEIRVVHRARTYDVLGELENIRHERGATISDEAAFLVTALPDIVKDGEPVDISLGLFDSMDARHTRAIVTAVMSAQRLVYCGHVKEWR